MDRPKVKIQLPFNFSPRPYQLPILKALDNGYKRAYGVWHRRAGKDKVFINYMAKEMFRKVGGYYYFLPSYRQGKKVIWNGRDKAGFKFTDHIPQALRTRTDNSDMLIEVKKPPSLMTEDELRRFKAGEKISGSLFQVIGTDNIDSIVGTNPVGCVFSEWPLQNPAAWDYIRPILAENGGWAIFNGTPRGKNHGWTLLQTARAFPDQWYSEVLTVEDTEAIPWDVLDQERLEMLRKDPTGALYEQEYMCSFDVPIQGAYYAGQLIEAGNEGRITSVPYDMNAKVHTYWDLGIDDSMTIWFLQVIGRELHLIDYITGSGEGINYYVQELFKKGYVYGDHWSPHDIKVRELGTGKSRLEVAKSLGIDFKVVPNIPIDDGIQAVRNLLNRCWFDKVRCEKGLDCLMSYHKEFDEANQIYKSHPEHDWSSHGCCCGETIVETSTGNKRIDEIKEGEYVLLNNDKAKVIKSGLVGYKDTLIINMSDGTKLEVTKDHKVFTTRGVVYADELAYDDLILNKSSLWKIKSLMEKKTGLREEYINYIKELNIGIGQNETYFVHRKKVDKHSFTELCGKILMDSYQKIKRYIQVENGRISKKKTGKLDQEIQVELYSPNAYFKNLMDTNITKNQLDISTQSTKIKEFTRQYGNTIILKFLKGIIFTILTVINRITKLATYSYCQLQNTLGFQLRRISGLVRKKIKNNWQNKEGFLQTLGGVRVVLIQPGRSKIPVYDLTIEKHHCYLANGLLVSNSDSFRYLAVAFRDIINSGQQTVVVNKYNDDPY